MPDKYRPLADINLRGYKEDGVELHGLKKLTQPEITHKMVTLEGAGFMGSVDVALAGMIDSMELGMEFSSASSTAQLMAPKTHRVTVYSVSQVWNVTKGRQERKAIKYVYVLAPKSSVPGDLAPMNQPNASGKYSVYYYAAYVDGEELWAIDPINQIFRVDGEDYYADIRKALGE